MSQTLGKYELLDELGAGTLAVVYKARDPSLERTVALKVFHQRIESDEEASRRFLRQVRVAATLTHPNIVSVYELGVHEGVAFIAMECLGGQDLRDLIEQVPPLGLRQKVNLALQLGRALGQAHARGVWHGDVKPANVRVLPGGVVKLMDFGIAAWLAEEDARLIRTGAVVASTPYRSPEQLRGEPPGLSSDAFSFGVVLYELLTGRRPFHAANPAATAMRVLHAEEPPIEGSDGQEIPPRLQSLVHLCLRKSADERPKGFESIVAELQGIRTELGARRAEAVEPEPRRRSGAGEVPTGTLAALAGGRAAGRSAGREVPTDELPLRGRHEWPTDTKAAEAGAGGRRSRLPLAVLAALGLVALALLLWHTFGGSG